MATTYLKEAYRFWQDVPVKEASVAAALISIAESLDKIATAMEKAND